MATFGKHSSQGLLLLSLVLLAFSVSPERATVVFPHGMSGGRLRLHAGSAAINGSMRCILSKRSSCERDGEQSSRLARARVVEHEELRCSKTTFLSSKYVDDMIKDINKSLQIMSKAQPKRGLIQNPSWGFQLGKSPGTWDDLSAANGGSSQNYLSSMFNTAKRKASGLRWPQPDFTTKDDSSENSASSAAPESSQAGGQGASMPDTERDELPISSQLSDGRTATNQRLPATDISKMVETYNKFKEEQELKLQEWLRESEEAEDNKE
ncbi:uncharacterized protein LOC133899448 [Phragmites australis]|uniref:uncharacterized protein LOC133899448 n=1 Tax=Phragmites australis TaxID=29695 RepID=UPI002D77BE37|nr:uncharacterized protein LOC133899448 [Phragmites australis]